MADASILKVDKIRIIERGSGIRTWPLVVHQALPHAAVEVDPAGLLAAHKQPRPREAAHLSHAILVGNDRGDAGAGQPIGNVARREQ